VIVHGMLVSLAVKQRLGAASPLAEGLADGGGWLYRSQLRQPVAVGQSLELAVRPQGDGVRFAVSAVGEGRKLLTGAVAPGKVERGDEAAVARLDLTAAEAAARTAELRSAFPWLTQAWVVADAVVFAALVGSDWFADALAFQGVSVRPGGRTPGDADRIVVQTGHEVGFDAAFFAADLPGGAWRIEGLTPETTPLDDGVFASFPLVVWRHERVVLRCVIELAVLARLGGAEENKS
jgi:hypothetical protein